MTTPADYQVLPDEPNYQAVTLTKDERKATKGLGGWGCLVWGVVVLASYFVIAYLGMLMSGQGSDNLFLASLIAGVIIATILVAVTSPIIKSKKILKIEREKNEAARQAELKRVTNAAKTVTSRAAHNYQSSVKLKSELAHHLEQASGWLQDAESEYRANAFGPFWDAVENAAKHLSEFNRKTNQLSRHATEYYLDLNGRKHTFPLFPVESHRIPEVAGAVKEMRRIVRLGQTNFQFANIWEHRRTREVLIAGFRTLGEAISNMTSVIESSISDLQQSVSSDVAKLAQEQIKTRDKLDLRMQEQNKMLNNIQHHRRPKLSDGTYRS